MFEQTMEITDHTGKTISNKISVDLSDFAVMLGLRNNQITELECTKMATLLSHAYSPFYD